MSLLHESVRVENDSQTLGGIGPTDPALPGMMVWVPRRPAVMDRLLALPGVRETSSTGRYDN